jgi:peroxiredoxin
LRTSEGGTDSPNLSELIPTMLQTLLLTTAFLTPAQPPQPLRPMDWNLSVQLERTQELVYRGTFTEECTTGSVQYQRAYRVETRLFVLDVSPKAADLATMTTLRPKDTPPAIKDETEGRSIRVEHFRVDPQGKISGEAGVNLVAPLEGPATAEVGFFPDLPRVKVSVEQTWEAFPQAGQPAMNWTATGVDTVQGIRCPILKGVQQTPDWDRPRADRKAWRRIDTVWVSPRTGVALKVERVIEIREPAHNQPTQKSVFRADLETTLPYPGQLYLDRQADIQQAIALRAEAMPLLPTPARNTTQLNALLKRITNHLDQTPPTPYRQAVLQVKSQVEAALRGEVLVTPTTVKPRAGLVIGELAPDFVTTDMSGQHSVGLKQLRGKPVVLAFYNPGSTLAPELLQFLSELSAATQGKARVLPLSVVEDAAIVKKQLTDLRLPGLTVLQGSGLRISYEVDSTPRVVLLDAQGYVRNTYTGWGRDLPREIQADLKPWLDR